MAFLGQRLISRHRQILTYLVQQSHLPSKNGIDIVILDEILDSGTLTKTLLVHHGVRALRIRGLFADLLHGVSRELQQRLIHHQDVDSEGQDFICTSRVGISYHAWVLPSPNIPKYAGLPSRGCVSLPEQAANSCRLMIGCRGCPLDPREMSAKATDRGVARLAKLRYQSPSAWTASPSDEPVPAKGTLSSANLRGRHNKRAAMSNSHESTREVSRLSRRKASSSSRTGRCCGRPTGQT